VLQKQSKVWHAKCHYHEHTSAKTYLSSKATGAPLRQSQILVCSTITLKVFHKLIKALHPFLISGVICFKYFRNPELNFHHFLWGVWWGAQAVIFAWACGKLGVFEHKESGILNCDVLPGQCISYGRRFIYLIPD